MIKVSAILLAAGSGSRMNAEINKVYLPLGNKKVIEYSLSVFSAIPEIKEIIIVYRAEDLDYLLEILPEDYSYKLVLGGMRRQDSVAAAVAAVSDNADYLLIHDGARPLIHPDFVRGLIEEAIRKKAVIPALPVIETVKEVAGNKVVSTLDRSSLVAVQTPQIFHCSLARYLTDNADGEGTDDASFLENHVPVYWREGLRYNIKLTTAEDLHYAEFLLDRIGELQWSKQA